MAIPQKSDARWKKLVTETNELELSSLATKMMLSRVRMIAKMDSTRVDEAINSAYEYFQKNEEMVQKDIKTIFG